jgi:uncharacterized protein
MTMMEAITKGDRARVAELLTDDPAAASERTPEGISLIVLAMYHRQPDIASLIASQREDLDVFEACCIGDLDRIRELLVASPDSVNSYSPDGFTPLALAAYFGHPEVVETLLAAGANPNIQAQNSMKVAPIHAAVAARNTRTVEILLRNGADANLQQQQGFTPMQAAVQNGDQAIIDLLKNHGAH